MKDLEGNAHGLIGGTVGVLCLGNEPLGNESL
jgi:hypothetical protein